MVYLFIKKTFLYLNFYIFCLQIAREHGGIMRFIHVSCLGASESSPSRLLSTKAGGEKALLEKFPEVNHMFY